MSQYTGRTESSDTRQPHGEMSRRDCLKWIARAVAVGAAFRHMDAYAGDEKGAVTIAKLMSMKNEWAKQIDKPECIVSRTDQGVACMSTYCTHKRNKLNVDADGTISCPVHSSIFDLTGKPIGGPASKPLTWYSTEVRDNGDIVADVSKTVEQGKWAELPAWAKPKKK